MSTIFILYVWAVTGFAGTQYSVHRIYDWREMGEYASRQKCQEAANQLNIKQTVFRCVDTGRK